MKKVPKTYTPVADFIEAYSQSNTVRAHMPGHKGIAPSSMPTILLKLPVLIHSMKQKAFFFKVKR